MGEIISTDYSKNNLEEISYVDINWKTNWLIISDNKVTCIPKEIINLKYLTRLAANDNKIEEISPEIYKFNLGRFYKEQIKKFTK